MRTEVITGAKLSDCRTWRYLLWRIWDVSKGLVLFIGLNPSTADETKDDPTIRRCVGFSKTWQAGGILMANLFAYRATRPSALMASSSSIGPMADQAILEAAKRSKLIICCWGANGGHRSRDAEVRELLKGYPLYHLGLTSKGQPKHPLYLRADTQPTLWRANEN